VNRAFFSGLQDMLQDLPVLRRFAHGLSERPRMRAVSFFSAGRLDVTVFGAGDAPSRESIPVPESPSQEDLQKAREKIAGFRQEQGTWIHVIPRQAAFVKTFSLEAREGESKEAAVLRRVREEMPHLADEILYHVALQENGTPGQEALLFGIAKATLEEQLRRLESLGVVPDSVMLSTELLLWLYQNDPSRREEDKNVLLVHDAARQIEVLYVDRGALVQSRWFGKEADEPAAAAAVLQTAQEAFQREWRRVPEKTLVLGNESRGGYGGIPCEGFGGEGPDEAALGSAALKAFASGAVFDFTPASWEDRRRRSRTGREKTRFAALLALFAASWLVLSASRAAGLALETAWLGVRQAPVSASVRELKNLRSQALKAARYSRKKTSPLLILAGLRAAAPQGLILQSLAYDEAKAVFSLKGEAVAENLIQDFLAGLQKQPGFEKMTLERLESSSDDRGRIFTFEIEGHLKKEKP